MIEVEKEDLENLPKNLKVFSSVGTGTCPRGLILLQRPPPPSASSSTTASTPTPKGLNYHTRQHPWNRKRKGHLQSVSANPLQPLYARPSKEECAGQLLDSLELLQLFRTEVDGGGNDDDEAEAERSHPVVEEDALDAPNDSTLFDAHSAPPPRSMSRFIFRADAIEFSPASKLGYKSQLLPGDSRPKHLSEVCKLNLAMEDTTIRLKPGERLQTDKQMDRHKQQMLLPDDYGLIE